MRIVNAIGFGLAFGLLLTNIAVWVFIGIYGSDVILGELGLLYRYIVLPMLPLFLYLLGASVVWKVLKFYTAKRWGWGVEVEVIETSGGKYDPVSYKVGMYSPARILLMFITALWPIIPVTAAVVFLVVVIYGAIKDLISWGRSASEFLSSRIIQLIDK